MQTLLYLAKPNPPVVCFPLQFAKKSGERLFCVWADGEIVGRRISGKMFGGPNSICFQSDWQMETPVARSPSVKQQCTQAQKRGRNNRFAQKRELFCLCFLNFFSYSSMTMGQEQKGSLLLSSLTNGPQNNNVLLIRCKIRRILEKIILFRLIYFSSMVNPQSSPVHFMDTLWPERRGKAFFL